METLLANPLLLCLAIFFARILDVSLGTIRTIMVFRGYRLIAAVAGFFEVLIWLAAASKVITNLQHWYLAVSYAAGFAAGNYIGIWFEGKIAMGVQLVRAISENSKIHLATELRKLNYTVTSLPAIGENSLPVEIVLVVEKRRVIPELISTIKEIDPHAFFTLEDVKYSYQAIFNKQHRPFPNGPMNLAKKK